MERDCEWTAFVVWSPNHWLDESVHKGWVQWWPKKLHDFLMSFQYVKGGGGDDANGGEAGGEVACWGTRLA